MHCRKCGGLAVINMRQHKLALCEPHFIEWVRATTQRFIEKYRMFEPGEKVLVAVSGGKDSLALWDIVLSLGYQADGLYLGLGIDGGLGYSDQSRACAEKFVRDFWPEAKLHVLDVKATYGESIPQVAQRSHRGRAKPCSACGLIKRHELNRSAYELGYAVLATGHNLDDEAAVLWGNTLHWEVEFLARQAPVLAADRPGFARKVKPLCRFYEREMAAYALVRGIDYVYDECPYSVGASSLSYKELLNRMEQERPGAKLNFYLDFLRAKENGLFARSRETIDLHPCERCGQPTSAPGLCAFCRLWANQTRDHVIT
ncbi:MAG TPA: TIGR00269 family protein [Anaerolineae bacterium]|nr:TIGR00269 family protein [Anaerolineae bacterium]